MHMAFSENYLILQDTKKDSSQWYATIFQILLHLINATNRW